MGETNETKVRGNSDKNVPCDRSAPVFSLLVTLASLNHLSYKKMGVGSGQLCILCKYDRAETCSAIVEGALPLSDWWATYAMI